MNSPTPDSTGFVSRENAGLEFSTREFRKLGDGRSDLWFWDPQVKQIVRGILGEFAPDVKELGEDRAMFFLYDDQNREVCHMSRTLGREGVPAAELDRLRARVGQLQQLCVNPGGGVDGDKVVDRGNREMLRRFTLPDPKTAPEMYRLHGSKSKPKLLILWGCARNEEHQIPAHGMADLPASISKQSGCRRWVGCLLWPLLVLLILAAILLGLKSCSEPPVTKALDSVSTLEGRMLTVRLYPESGCLPVTVEAEAREPGLIRFHSLGEVKASANTPYTFGGITKAGRYRIEWIPDDPALEEEFHDVLVKDCNSSEPDLSAALWVSPSRVEAGQPVFADVSASIPSGEGAIDPIKSYRLAWQEGDVLSEVDPAEPIERVFDEPGEYLVTLRVETESGRSDDDKFLVTVLTPGSPVAGNLPPVVYAELQNQDNANFKLSLTDTGSYDPDGTINRWEIQWGDGSPAEVVSERPNKLVHDYDELGDETSFLITVTAVDNQEAEGRRELEVDFSAEPPSLGTLDDDPNLIVKGIDSIDAVIDPEKLRIRKIGQGSTSDTEGRVRVELDVLPTESDPDATLGPVTWKISDEAGEAVYDETASRRIALQMKPGRYTVEVATESAEGRAYTGSGRFSVSGPPGENPPANGNQSLNPGETAKPEGTTDPNTPDGKPPVTTQPDTPNPNTPDGKPPVTTQPGTPNPNTPDGKPPVPAELGTPIPNTPDGKPPIPNTPEEPDPNKPVPTQPDPSTEPPMSLDVRSRTLRVEGNAAVMEISATATRAGETVELESVRWILPENRSANGTPVQIKLPLGSHRIAVSGKVGSTSLSREGTVNVGVGNITVETELDGETRIEGQPRRGETPDVPDAGKRPE